MRQRPLLRPTLVIVILAGALVSFDGVLARTEMREVRGEASQAFQQGTLLLRQNKAEQAVAPLRKAWVLARENPEYALQLGNALTRVGKLNESEPLISDALDRKPNDGEANLSAARLMIRKNELPLAVSYFHRAIYGAWKTDAPARRIEARTELIRLLAEQKRTQEMLAELISLDGETTGQVPIRKRLAHYYMVAGSPVRAADVYRDLAEKDPSDTEALIGLGEAELQGGQYRPARNAFLRAALHSPGAPIQSRLQLVDTLATLDPTPRRLTSLEKYRRSRRILGLVREDLEQLVGANPKKASEETARILGQAAETLSNKEPNHVNNEMAEGILTLVEEIWRTRVAVFGESHSDEEEPLRLLCNRLAA